jgi:hypothetical protein
MANPFSVFYPLQACNRILMRPTYCFFSCCVFALEEGERERVSVFYCLFVLWANSFFFRQLKKGGAGRDHAEARPYKSRRSCAIVHSASAQHVRGRHRCISPRQRVRMCKASFSGYDAPHAVHRGPPPPTTPQLDSGFDIKTQNLISLSPSPDGPLHRPPVPK